MRERASDSVVRPEADKLSPKAAEFRPAPSPRFFNAPICRFGPPPLPPGPEPVVAPSQPHGISISTDNSGSAAADDGAVCTTEGQFDSEKVASGLSSELGPLDPVPAAAGQILQGAADVATGATGVGAAALPVAWVDVAEAAWKGVRGQGRRTKRRLKRISRLAAENHWLVGRISKLVVLTRRWLAFRLGSVGSTPGLRERLYNSLFVSTEIVGSAELAVAVDVPAGALVSSSAAAAEAARAAAAAADAAKTLVCAAPWFQYRMLLVKRSGGGRRPGACRSWRWRSTFRLHWPVLGAFSRKYGQWHWSGHSGNPPSIPECSRCCRRRVSTSSLSS